jgi:hypothetical protein
MRAQCVPGTGAAVAAQGLAIASRRAMAIGPVTPEVPPASASACGCPCRSCRCRAARTGWGRIFSAQGLHQLQVAPGCHRKVDQCVAALHQQLAGHATTRAPGCARRRSAVAAAAAWACARSAAPQACRLAACNCSSSLRRPSALSNCHSGRWLSSQVPAGCLQRFQSLLEGGRDIGAEDQLAGVDAGQPVVEFVGRALRQVQFTLCHAQPGQTTGVARGLVHRQQDRLGLV